MEVPLKRFEDLIDDVLEPLSASGSDLHQQLYVRAGPESVIDSSFDFEPNVNSHEAGGGDPRLHCFDPDLLQRRHQVIEAVSPHQGKH